MRTGDARSRRQEMDQGRVAELTCAGPTEDKDDRDLLRVKRRRTRGGRDGVCWRDGGHGLGCGGAGLRGHVEE